MSGTSAKGGKYHYYVCSRYYAEGTDACTGVRVRQSRLEDFEVMQLRDRILTPDSLRELTRMVNEELREDIGSIGSRPVKWCNGIAPSSCRSGKLLDQHGFLL
jgi:hypothetical protein